MTARVQLVCPNCGADDIASWESVSTAYYGTRFFLGLNPSDQRVVDDSDVYDSKTGDGQGFEDDLHCNECTWNGCLADLVTARFAAHTAKRRVVTIDEESDRGADVRFAAFCDASIHGTHVSYTCQWKSPWEHADSYVSMTNAHGEHGSGPSQLAYEAAESASRQHLIDEGVDLD